MTKRIEGDERARVRAEWEARLGRRRVWFVDDPGVAEVIGSAEDLALLECIRAATRPLTLADLVDAGHLQPGPSSDRLDRLERAGFIEYRQERRGRPAKGESAPHHRESRRHGAFPLGSGMTRGSGERRRGSLSTAPIG